MDRDILKAAFPLTLPVLMGYLSIGMAFGLMLDSIGYNVLWSFLMSVTIYAGSGQYLGVFLLSSAAALSQVAILTFVLNFRHLVYGLSMLERFKGMGWRKLYMIFALTDETYALLAGVEPPAHVDAKRFYFTIALLNHLYWLAGSILGSLAGALIGFNTTGADFAMTALFLVIAVEQWKSNQRHLPVFLGLLCALGALVLFGGENMLLPALCVLVAALLVLQPLVERKGASRV